VGTSGAESWTLNKYIAKRLAALKKRVLRRTFGGIKVNENLKTRYNKLLGDLDTL
jgi:hypothetical protein